MRFDIEAITNPRLAPGLVEDACCHRLRDEAARVPTRYAVVELGAFKGRTTGWLAMGSQMHGNGAHVYSVDPFEDGETLPADYVATSKTILDYRRSATRETYEQHLERTGVRGYVTSIPSTGVDAARTYTGPPVGLLWHDALHRVEDVRADLRAWLPHMAPDATIMLHDVGERRFGVEAGAEAVLASDRTWNWKGRETHLWTKNPNIRGYLVVRTTNEAT